MSTSVARPRNAPRAGPRHGRVRVLAAVAAAVVLAVATLVWWWPSGGERALAGSATVTASSTAIGSSARDALRADSAASPGPGWRSGDGDTVGAWLELSWRRAHVVHQILITRNPLTEPGATDGLLTFGDGSVLQMRLSGTYPTTIVPITPREVDRLRFTVSAVAPSARNVTISAFGVNDEPGVEVAVDGAPAGNAAAAAVVTQSSDAGGADPRALQDGSGAPGAEGSGSDWATERPAGAWVQLDWDRPRELSSIELMGSTRSAAGLAAATLSFDDGATLPIGAVLPEPARPTVVAFVPRVVRSVRLRLDQVEGTGALALGELRTYQRGFTPPRVASAASPSPAPAAPAPCVDTPATDTNPVVVRCPGVGSTIEGPVDLRVDVAPGYSLVTATVWPADAAEPTGPSTSAAPDSSGTATLTVDTSATPPGPLQWRSRPPGTGQTRPGFTLSSTAEVHSAPKYRPAPRGRRADAGLRRGVLPTHLAVADRDRRGLRGGQTRPLRRRGLRRRDLHRPHPGLPRTCGSMDDRYLRIHVAPVPSGFVDPQGWDRVHLGGLPASAREGGSGFSAQYGYFEARMLAPAAPGTWPAFWMLPSDNLVAPTRTVAEIDAVELYGHNPTRACQSTHSFKDGEDNGLGQCEQRQPTERDALAWHTYGVSVLPTGITFFIDGHVTATAPQVEGGDAPLFFLVDLALDGGWPVQLKGVQDRASLYVDYIRVYV